jgi:putative peptidoglycan lipid II flippase
MPDAISPAPSTESATAVPLSRAPGLLRAAGLIAAVTILSKLLGMLRDIGVAGVYGASMVSDAYFAAFQLPSFALILLGGLGGPFHTATVAIFSRLIDDNGPPGEQAKKLAATVITLTGLVFALLSLATFLAAEPIMATILHGAAPGKIAMAAEQLRIMSPILLVGGVIGIFYGLLNVYHVFFWPSLSPAGLSLVILLALWLFPQPDATGRVLAWATLGGAVAQWLMQVPDFVRRGFPLFPAQGTSALDWRSPHVRQWCEILFPALVSTTIGQLNVYVDMFFTSYLPEGGWTAVILGNRLIQFPIGVLQTALLVPIFPRFSRYAAAGDLAAIKRDFRMGVVSLWLISLPMLVVLLMDTEIIIRLIFQRGQFDADGTRLVSQAMIGLAFQMLPYFARDSITRVFFAFQDAKTPLRVGLLAIAFNAFFDWLFAGALGLGVMGITLSTTAVTLLNMLFLGLFSKKHIADLGFREMVAPFAKLSLAGAAMAGLMALVQPGCLAVLRAVSATRLPGTMTEIVATAFVALLGLGVYGLIILNLRIPEADLLRERLTAMIRRRLPKRPG